MLFVDLPGHGKSARPAVDYTMDRFATAVDAVHQWVLSPQWAEPVIAGSVAAAILLAVRFRPSWVVSLPAVVLASEDDPWMRFESVCAWARVWGTQVISLGAAGHINTESGFGPLPQAGALVELMVQRLERERRIDRADLRELHFAI